MKINKKYILTTTKRSITGVKVKVVGIINYDECKKTGYDVVTLGLNEKVISESYDEYLGGLSFYKCENLVTGALLIVWDDIVDTNNTNLLEETYTYGLKIETPTDTGSSISSIITDIVTYAKGKYNATLSFTPISGDDNVLIERMKVQMAQYESIVQSLSSLKTIIPSIERIQNGDMTSRIDSIIVKVDNIADKVTTISTGLSA